MTKKVFNKIQSTSNDTLFPAFYSHFHSNLDENCFDKKNEIFKKAKIKRGL